MKSLIMSLIFLFIIKGVNAQTDLTGNLQQDSKILLAEYDQHNFNTSVNYLPPQKKSPVLGGLFSLILPGAGEFYSEKYVKAAIFAGVEAIIITTALIYDNKGDVKTNEFQDYADDRWSVVRYAEWINTYQHGEINIDYTTPDLEPWERVNWVELNAYEHGSHRLPPHGDQQYYELIGKYFQYSAGWDDYTSGENNAAMSPNFHFYSGMRGDANDFYNVATKAVMFLYINHFLSMLDGIWSVTQFNSNIAVNLRVEDNLLTRKTDFIPSVNLRISF